MTPQPGKQTIPMHILAYIPRSKTNQTKKFGQLIEYNMRNIFLEKSNTKCGREGLTVWNAIKFVFIVCPSGGLPKYTKIIKVLITCFYLL